MIDIPETYNTLLIGKGPTIFSVVAEDGTIQSSLVWSDFEGGLLSISMLNTAPKFKRLVRHGKATILKYDPEDEKKYISMRCSLVRIDSDNAIAHLNRLTQRHYGKKTWYGEVVPNNEQDKKNEVVVYLKPEKIYFTQ